MFRTGLIAFLDSAFPYSTVRLTGFNENSSVVFLLLLVQKIVQFLFWLILIYEFQADADQFFYHLSGYYLLQYDNADLQHHDARKPYKAVSKPDFIHIMQAILLKNHFSEKMQGLHSFKNILNSPKRK